MSFVKSYAVVSGLLACVAVCAGPVLAAEGAVKEESDKKTVAQTIPITMSNLRGHQALAREGWRIVSSSDKALDYAKEHAIASSGRAIAQALADARRHSGEYASNLKESGKNGVETGVAVYQGGTEFTKADVAVTGALVKAEWDYGSENAKAAWQRFIQGNLTLGQRTSEDWQALKAVRWYTNLGSDFSNLNTLTGAVLDEAAPHIEADWGRAADEARAEFDEAYRRSGTRGNSLAGVGDMLMGYVGVLYSGLVKPASKSAAAGVESVAKGAAKMVFLPTAGVFMVSGRTIESAGLSVYYGSSMGIKLVSPTVEGGMLLGLSMLSYGALLPTAAAGATVGVVNQVALTPAGAVAAGAGRAVAAGAADTGLYGAQVSYDLIKGATRVTLNTSQSAVVLGYNALTAIPAHLLLGTMDGAMFLAWDGPRLVVAAAKGQVQWSDKHGEQRSVPVSSLPVGSVVNLKALGQEPGVQVRTISDDPEVVQKVLEQLPDDLREKGQP